MVFISIEFKRIQKFKDSRFKVQDSCCTFPTDKEQPIILVFNLPREITLIKRKSGP